MKPWFASSVLRVALAVMVAAMFLGFSSPSQAVELLMFKSSGCTYCIIWDDELGGVYAKTTEGAQAPLRRVEISDQKKTDGLKMPVRLTPTFVLMDEGKEIGRIQGYGGEGAFWVMLEDLLQKMKMQNNRLALNASIAK